VLNALEDCKAALNFYDKAIEVDDKFSYAYYHKGYLLYLKYQNIELGCDNIYKVETLGFKDVTNFLNKGYCDDIKTIHH